MSTSAFVNEVAQIVESPAFEHAVEGMVAALDQLRARGGRLFVLGLGGGAANASHAVNDLRKLCGIEAYAPTDGIAELTARVNDDGFDSVFAEWLAVSRVGPADALLVFSVGGGQPGVSGGITSALEWAAMRGAHIFGIVGRADGEVARRGHVVLVVEAAKGAAGSLGGLLTPVTETVQIAALHALVSHPRLQWHPTKW